MIFENIKIGNNVQIDPSSSINNVIIADNVKIAKRCSIFGSKEFPLVIGKGCYIGMNCMLHGFSGQVIIGDYVSFAQDIYLMTDSGPNASPRMQKVFPILKGNISIGSNSWIGAGTIIMPNVRIGKFCVIGANSFVNRDIPDYTIWAGSPIHLIRQLSNKEIEILTND